MSAPSDEREAELAGERLRAASEVLREIRETSPAWQVEGSRPSLTLIQGGHDA